MSQNAAEETFDIQGILAKWVVPTFVGMLVAVGVLQYQVLNMREEMRMLNTKLENVTDIRIELAGRAEWMKSVNRHIEQADERAQKTDLRIEFLMKELRKG